MSAPTLKPVYTNVEVNCVNSTNVFAVRDPAPPQKDISSTRLVFKEVHVDQMLLDVRGREHLITMCMDVIVRAHAVHKLPGIHIDQVQLLNRSRSGPPVEFTVVQALCSYTEQWFAKETQTGAYASLV